MVPKVRCRTTERRELRVLFLKISMPIASTYVASTPDRARPGLVAGGLLLALGLALGVGLASLWPGKRAAVPTSITSVAIPIGTTLRVSG